MKALESLSLPVKRRFLSAVKGILQLLHQVGLSWEPEQTLLPKAPLPDEIHTLLHKHGGQFVPKAPFVPNRLLKLLAKYAWNAKREKKCLMLP